MQDDNIMDINDTDWDDDNIDDILGNDFDDDIFEESDTEEELDEDLFEDEPEEELDDDLFDDLDSDDDAVGDDLFDGEESDSDFFEDETDNSDESETLDSSIFEDSEPMENDEIEDEEPEILLADEVDENEPADSMIIDHTDEEDTEASLYEEPQYDLDAGEDIEVAEASPSDYDDGVLISAEDLLAMDEEPGVPQYGEVENHFINDSGGIVVQRSDDDGRGFELKYIDIEKVAITNRIRSLKSVESLIQSIKSTGLLEPITVAPTATEGLYVLLDGLRRIQACARAGMRKIPCIINNMVSTPEIPIIEALYNHNKSYSITEQINHIEYLEKQKGISNPNMIEYILQMNSGDYTKLKDILNDDDDDIVSRLYSGEIDIATAFKKLEQRRRKESAEEKEKKKADKVYGDEAVSGIAAVQGAGESGDGEPLTPEQVEALSININNLDDDADSADLGEMVEEDSKIEGFEAHKQKVGEREYIDPIIKKTVMARDKFTCKCCKRGGEQYVDILDYHHILPVFLGGADTPENGVMLCVACHRLVHLYSTGDLHIPEELLKGSYDNLSEEQIERYPNNEIFEDEQAKFKRVVMLGSTIRKGIAARGMNREQYKKEHSNNGIGRRKPGKNAPQEHS